VRLTLRIRDLLVASWTITRADAERLLPPGLEPATVDGEYIISLVAMRQEARPRHRQINVRTYVKHEGGEAVYFLLSRVTLPGLVGVLFGAPYGAARIAVERGRVEAPGLGVSLRYRVEEETSPGPIGLHETGLFGRSRLRAVRISRGPAEWRRAVLVGALRADPIASYGFQVEEPKLLYAEETVLVLDGRLKRGKIRSGELV
jgi:hypothetical protein